MPSRLKRLVWPVGCAAIAIAALVSGCSRDPPESDRVFAGNVFSGSYPKPRDYPIHGIDVSKFQGDIDWNAVANSGVKFAWIKATEGGDRVDARFQANWEGAKAAGIPHGAYHFVYWCRPPLEEIKNFEHNAPVEDDALPPVLDVEATPTSPTCHRRLTQDGAIADMRVMLREMERHYGKRPIIYTTVDFYQAILSNGALADYPIWVRSTKHHPAVKYGSRVWHFWQYQSDGRIPGIASNVDKDAFYGTREQWDAFMGAPGPLPVQAAREGSAPAPAPQQTAATDQPQESWGGAGLIAHKFSAEAVGASPAAHHAAPPAQASADFGAMIVEPEWVAKPASPNIDYSSVASLETAPSANIPLPSLEAFPLVPSAKAVPRPPDAPLGKASAEPPGNEVARLENGPPLPPPRPPGLGEPKPSAAPQIVQPAAPAAPVETRNFFQKMFGLGLPPMPGTLLGTQASIAPESHAVVKAAAAPRPPAVAAAPMSSGLMGSGWFGFGASQATPQGHNRQTAVYDILARTVYLPNGTRLEAHSGLGDRLDDPRYVNERARGATPPHLYELTLREGSFHGVQALRLTPIGEGDVYGRVGLLAHPYMLGPNGDSNGCVSVKDYNAFLRAYANGQINRLMVVASANQVIATAEPQARSSPR
jgi:lysozyme